MLSLARPLLATLLALALTASACGVGREDVELLPQVQTDGGADGTRTCSMPPGACLENGASCTLASECCSGRCDSGTCLEARGCAGPGLACSTRADCCSGRCDSVPGKTGKVCLDYCLADGRACTLASDCCSLGCHGGVCGAPLCAPKDTSCQTNADCCSGLCSREEHTCDFEDSRGCVPAGERCDSGGGTACCSGACDATTQRCDFGPGPCLALGSICAQDADCCHGTCVQGAGGVRTCTGACVADGQSCVSGGDCCSGHCVGSPGACGPAANACKRVGATCSGDGECCTGQCLRGTCGTNCASP